MDEAFLQNLVPYSLSLCCLVILLLLLLRFVYLVKINGREKVILKRDMPCRTVLVLGSGGHTSEMIGIVGGLNIKNYTPRLYVVSRGDKMSEGKAKAFELSNGKFGTSAVAIQTIPRPRQALQSYFTSIFTTLSAITASFYLVFSFRPDLVLCNGPGTCIPICFWAYLIKFFCLRETKIIYVESLCRVQRLSLSGIILYYLYMADYVFVQWPRLKELYPRTRLIGRVL